MNLHTVLVHHDGTTEKFTSEEFTTAFNSPVPKVGCHMHDNRDKEKARSFFRVSDAQLKDGRFGITAVLVEQPRA